MNVRMRILHVVEATVAGVRRHVETLACGLNGEPFEVAVACPEQRATAFGDDQFVPALRRAGVTVLPIPMVRPIHPASDTRALARLVRIIRSGRYDIVHTHSSKAGFLGRLAARLAGGPATIYTPNGLFFLSQPDPARRRFYLALEQLAGHLTDRVVAVSPGERDLLLQHRIAPPERVACITNGIEPPVLPPGYDRAAWRRSIGLSAEAFVAGTVARVSAQKNPWLFLEAAARVLRNAPQTRFVWCGGGELEAAALQRAQALGIAHACRFLGHREDAAQALAAFDLFWLTSDYEGLPHALLEALALRIPAIATDVVGSRDLLGGSAGVLAPPGDAAAFAQATLELLRHPDRREHLAAAGFARFTEQGAAEAMLRATAQLYIQLIAEHRRSTGAMTAQRLL